MFWVSLPGIPKTLVFWVRGYPKHGDTQNTVTPEILAKMESAPGSALGTRLGKSVPRLFSESKMAAAGDFGDFCFLCKGKVTVSGKIRIFGKSSVNIHSLILRATKVDLSVYAKKENLVICNPKCYKRLMKYQRALRKLDEILDEIEGDFRRDGPIGVKRLAEEPGRAPEANKSLKTTDGKDTRTIVESCSSQLKPSPVTTISCIVNATPIVPRPKEVSNVNSASVIPRLKEASNVKLNSTPILLRPTEVNNTNISTPVFLRPTEVINVNSSPLILKPTEVSNINSTPVPILPSPNVQVNNVINSTPILARPTAVSNVDSTQILKTPTEVCVTVFTRPVAMLPTQPSVPAYQTGLTQHSATGGLNAAQILTRMLPKPGSDQKKQLFVTKTPPQGTKVLQSHASIPTGCLQTSASAFGGSNSGQILTIIPSKPMSNQQQKLPVIETPPKTTEVHITIKHPSKTVHRVLTNDFAVIGKALVAGGYDQIAGAVLKNVCLKAIVVEKVLKLLTLQVNELCSTKRPSLLRSNSKERTSSDFEKVCLEWKGRAPIFYSFLMTCAVVKREKAPEWLPGVAIAGSVLLKQRNSHMNAGCAKILKMLLKSRSLEVKYFFCYFQDLLLF